jgi:hypothetical protein
VYRVFDKITCQKSSVENRYIIYKYSDKQTVECMSEENFYRELSSLKELVKDDAMPNNMLIPDCITNSIQLEEWTCSITRLVIEQVLQNASHFAVFQRKLFKN